MFFLGESGKLQKFAEFPFELAVPNSFESFSERLSLVNAGRREVPLPRVWLFLKGARRAFRKMRWQSCYDDEEFRFGWLLDHPWVLSPPFLPQTFGMWFSSFEERSS